ncbi:hypothetical protein JW921_06650 [Candidatus Fermentibacterales bacterium]|nr:hypothetical protein [Candidatus Fermentibacterales bacterium]
MRSILVCFVAACFVWAADSYMLEGPVYCVGDPRAVLQYDDGTAWWLTWGGAYRGVWFNVEDFSPGVGFDCEQLEFWFYHHATYPWTSASFEGILANGDATAPATELANESITATHYAPSYAVYGSVVTEANFWGVDHSLVAGGWPSILGDNGVGAVGHSFYSDAFGSGYTAWAEGDYFIRAHGTILTTSLDYTSWGAIKSLYDQQ